MVVLAMPATDRPQMSPFLLRLRKDHVTPTEKKWENMIMLKGTKSPNAYVHFPSKIEVQIITPMT